MINRAPIKAISFTLIALLLLSGVLLPLNVSATDTNTWSAAANSSWSVDASWSLGHVPLAAEAVVFDATSVKNCQIDVDTNALYSFSINSGFSGVISNSASCDVTTTSDITISAGTVTSVTTAVWTCGGNFIQTGTITLSVFNLVMTGASKTLALATFNAIRSLTINGTVTTTSTNIMPTVIFTIGVGAKFTYSGSGKLFIGLALCTYTNLGILEGSGVVDFYPTNSAPTLTFGTVNCPVLIDYPTGANRIVALGANAMLGSTLTINDAGEGHTVTLSHGSNYQLQVAGLTTVSTRAILTQGTGAWTFSGGFTQSGVSSVFNQGGTVSAATIILSAGIYNGNGYELNVSGSLDSIGSTFSPGNSLLKMTGASKTLKTAASLYDLTIDSGASVTLSASVTVTHTLTLTGIFAPAIYTVTNTGGNAVVSTDFAISTAATFIAGNTMSVSGNWDSSIITFIQGSSLVTLSGTSKTVKLSAAQTFYDLTVSGSYTESSNIAVSHNLIVSGSISHGINYLLAVIGITVNTGSMVQGSGLWAFTGIYFQSGYANYSMGGNVNSGSVSATGGTMNLWYGHTWISTGDWNINGSIFNPGRSSVVLAGVTKTLKIGVGQYFYNLTIQAGANYTLQSDIYMVHRYFENGTVIYNGYQVFYPVILIADFSYTVFVGLVNFTDTSVAVYGILNWTWTFGDGGSAYSQHPAHDYSVTGIYTVILYIYDHNGNMAFMPRSVNITVPVAPPTPLAILIADFTYIVVVGHINFTDVSISNKGIINWTWTFGDGGSAYSQHPAHDYAASNNFTVILRIVDNDTNTAVRPQTVSISLPITPTLPPMVLTVIFSYFGNDGLLHFSDESVSSVGISNWSWSFGDGGFSFDVNPSHNYSLSGVYPVTLIIIDSNGNMQSLTRNVVVSVPFDLFRTISLLPPIFFFAIAMILTGLMGRVLAKRRKSKKGSRYATLIFVIGITAVIISLLTGGFALW